MKLHRIHDLCVVLGGLGLFLAFSCRLSYDLCKKGEKPQMNGNSIQGITTYRKKVDKPYVKKSSNSVCVRNGKKTRKTKI